MAYKFAVKPICMRFPVEDLNAFQAHAEAERVSFTAWMLRAATALLNNETTGRVIAAGAKAAAKEARKPSRRKGAK